MKTDLTPYTLNATVVKETANRIIQDFEGFGISIVFSGEESSAYNELMSQLIPSIEELVRSNKPKLMQVLYRIDISEKKLSSELKLNPSVSLAAIISRLVIEREMQKVLTRMFYKKDSK